MAEIDLSTAVFFTTGSGVGGTPYGKFQDGAIVTNVGWPDFYFPGMTLEPDVEYEVTVTYDSGHSLDNGGREFYAAATLTDQTDQVAIYDAWFDTEVWLSGGPQTDTFSFTIPSGQDPDRLTPAFESDIDGALVSLDIEPPPGSSGGSGPTWSSQIRLTTDADPFGSGSDEGSLASGDLCYLGDGLVVVMSFSFYSYAVRLWAIDCSGTVPDVGPMKVVNGTDDNFSWMDNPHPGDARGAAMYPCKFVVRTGPTTFAITGGGNETYNVFGNLDPSGDYVHVVSYFEVDPLTKEIERTSFVVQDYTQLQAGWIDDASIAPIPGEDQGVVVLGWDFDIDVMIAYPGTVDNYTLGPPASNAGPVTVVGDKAVFLTSNDDDSPDDPTIVSMDVNSAVFAEGEVLVGAGEHTGSWFATATDTGKAAFLTSGVPTLFGNLSTGSISHIDPGTLTNDAPVAVAPDSWTYGWTSDWGGNVRSISPRASGKTMVSYVEYFDRLMYCVEVAVTKAAGTPTLVPFPNPNGYFVQMARSVAVDESKVAAMMVRQTDGSYEGGDHIFGVYFILGDITPAPVAADVIPERIRSHYWGQR